MITVEVANYANIDLHTCECDLNVQHINIDRIHKYEDRLIVIYVDVFLIEPSD